MDNNQQQQRRCAYVKDGSRCTNMAKQDSEYCDHHADLIGNRRLASGLGFAASGAFLGGPIGAIIGGLIGFAIGRLAQDTVTAQDVNDGKNR